MTQTPPQEYRLIRISLTLAALAVLVFATITRGFLKPGDWVWMYLLLAGQGATVVWLYRRLTTENCRQTAGLFVLMELVVLLTALGLHRVEYVFVAFLVLFTCLITFNVVLVHWPEVVFFNFLILASSSVFMFWPATGFTASVARLGMHPGIVTISVLVFEVCTLVLGSALVEVKRRTEGQLRVINQDLNLRVEEKVAELRRADMQARRAEAQLEQILRYTPVGVVIFGEDLECIYSNGVHFKFEQLEGVCRELPGNLLSLDMIQQILDQAKALAGTDPETHLVGQRLDFVDAEQNERMLRYSFVPVTLEATAWTPAFKRMLLITEDITREEILRYKLIQADHLSAMGKMAAGLAHEINNPLSVIRIYVEALGQGVADPVRREKIYLVLKENIMRIDRIIKSFLTFGRQEKPTRELIDVLAVLKNTLELATNLRQFDEIKICTEFSDVVPPVFGDQHRLAQVFVNLLNNARDAMVKTGGTLTIQYGCEPEAVVIRFKDTGHGIKPEDLKHIFTPFFTTKEPGQGTGLGLSISYAIIQEHGGTLEAESREGVGTQFTISLPLPAGGARPGSTPASV